MENSENIIFEEKQYLGYNRYSNVRRMVLAVFCFLAYYWTEEHNRNGEILFAMGIVIVVISALLIFVLHLHTKVTDTSIILDGLWAVGRGVVYSIVMSRFAELRSASLLPHHHIVPLSKIGQKWALRGCARKSSTPW